MEKLDRAIEEARRAGIDPDLLDSNSALSYEERAERHASALELVRELRKNAPADEKPARSAEATG